MKKNYDQIDIMKFILALMVVAIHINPLGIGSNTDNIRFPILGIAVPIFFMTSSFFFFKKYNVCKKENLLKEYVIRNLKLYFSWFIILLPYTIYINKYYNKNIINVLCDLIVRFFFNSTFPASWFIMAIIIGTTIIFYLSKKFGDKITFLVCIIVYAICICGSTYYNFLQDGLIKRIIDGYPLQCLVNSFPVALLDIMIGKIIAKNEEYINKKISMKKILIISAICLIALLLEYKIIELAVGISRYSCSIFMPITCATLFVLVLKLNIKCNFAKKLRKLSTVMYCSHIVMGGVVGFICKKIIKINIYILPTSIFVYIMVAILSIFLGIVIDKLKEYKYTLWLRNFQ